MNKLYFGDCLDILIKLHHENPKGFIDLIYIDPPFNSKRNYNILFEDAEFGDTKAQKEAFADTWSNISYKDTLEQIKALDLDLYAFLESLDHVRISKSAVSYLTMMAIRIWYMHKVLKDEGSFYLHCDPTMSHYLKIVCDLIFGNKYFRNEIIWHYRRWTGKAKKFQELHDVIFYYTKTSEYTFNVQYTAYTDGSRDRKEQGILHRFKKGEKPYLVSDSEIDEKGVRENDVWHIPFIAPSSKERLGYPTQKPEALLARIIKASSNENDLVADFFCGCGTTIAVAQKNKRKWIGTDISSLSIGLIERRLIHSYGKKIKHSYSIDGLPKDITSAKKLAQETEQGRLKFQDWVIEALLGGVHNPKRTADGGWDGHFTFDLNGKKEVVLIEVKSGNVNVKNVREFIEVTSKQKAAMGIFVCFDEQVTKPMLLEAKEQGYYRKDLFDNKYDKIQILTIEKMLEGEYINKPDILPSTFKVAEEQAEYNKQEEIF